MRSITPAILLLLLISALPALAQSIPPVPEKAPLPPAEPAEKPELKTPEPKPEATPEKAPEELLTAEEAEAQKAEKAATVQGTLDERTGYTLPEMVGTLNQASLQEAFRLLKSEYIKREDLNHLTLNRAAIQGLLERLEFGAMLLTEASRSAGNSPFTFQSARLDDSIAYARFGKFSKDELSSFDEVISSLRQDEKIKSLILDLRSPQPQAKFDIAAEILSRFRPPNELLFKIRRPGNDRAVLFPSKSNATSWSKEVVVLVDNETGNVGEIIASVLQTKNNSLIIGEKTMGLTVEYRDVPIGKDRILRYAIAEVILEDERTIFQVGVEPDLPTDPEIKAKHAVFQAVDDGKPISDYLFRKERPRMNEAALVAGTDPELEYYLAKRNDRPTEWDIFLPHDRVLQKTVDILRSRNFLDKGKRKKKTR